MTDQKALQKIAQYFENNKKFVVLPVDEYEDLVMMSDPSFWKALAESEADVRVGRVKDLDQVIKELGLNDGSKTNKKSRKRSKKAR